MPLCLLPGSSQSWGALGVSCWMGDLCPPHAMLSEAPPFSCPPSQEGEQVAMWEQGPWVGHQAGLAQPLWGLGRLGGPEGLGWPPLTPQGVQELYIYYIYLVIPLP